MRLTILIGAAAVALAAGCDRGEPARSSPAGSAPTTAPSPPPTSPSPSSSASGGATSSTTTPAPASRPEHKDGTNPTQGQVDPKEGEQRKDFQQKGDSAGPTSADTKPKN